MVLNKKSVAGAVAGVVLLTLVLNVLVLLGVVGPLIMVGAALLHWIVPAVPAIGYWTGVAIGGVIMVIRMVLGLAFR